MATTVKRIHAALTKEQLRQLDELKNQFGENTSEVIKRSLMLLYHLTFDKN